MLLAFIASQALAAGAGDHGAPVLDERCYWREYVQFGLDRLDAAALKADGEALLGKRGMLRLRKRVLTFFKPPYAPANRKVDWTKTDWRDRALIWFQTTQWGSGRRASFFSHSPPAPAGWAGPQFDDRAWMRSRLPLLVGNFRRERRTWGDHDMQQLEVRAAYFRTRFQVADPKAKHTLALTYRGGARVFVNGTEVGRGHLEGDDLAQPYPREAYVRLADEAPPGTHAGVVKGRGTDFCADLIGRFEDAAKTLRRAGGDKYWTLNIGWGTQVINRKGWDRITRLRNRRIGPVVIPAGLLRKGSNLLAVEVRAAPLHPVVVTGRGANWGRSYFLHGQFTWAHCRLLELELRSADKEAPSALTRPAGVQVWAEDIHRRLVDRDVGPADGGPGVVRFVGAANGTFSAQVVVGTDRELAGLSVRPSPLKSETDTLPASALRVEYLRAHPLTGLVKLGRVQCYPGHMDSPLKSSAAEMAVYRYGPAGPRIIEQGPEAMRREMERIRYFDHIGPTAPARVPADTCQPVWLSLSVPSGAKPGTYRGAVTVEAAGMKPIRVPVEAEVIGWQIPDPKDFQTVVALDHSPYGVARQYGVGPWSDEHFRLIEPSLRQLGRVGNTWLLVPVICHTEFGNETYSMIRWTVRKDGTLGFDYAVLDRVIDQAVKHWGVPRAICFVVMHGAGREGGAANSQVAARDERTGQTVMLDVSSKSRDFRRHWKAFATDLYAHLKRRGLERSMCWGVGWDTWGDAALIPLLKEFAPEVRWAQSSHPGGPSKTVRVSFTVTVGQLTESSSRGWRNRDLNLLNPRAGNNITSSNGTSPPFTFRLMVDRALVAGKNGLGRMGADYWKGTYFHKSKNFVRGGAAGMPCATLLWPGPNGAESSQRFEALREGIQETEARIFLEQALQRGALPKELAGRVQQVLFEHNRQTLYISAGRVGTQILEYCHGWQARSRRLFRAAAEAAEALGFSLDRAQIVADLPARGKRTVAVTLRNWSATPRAWAASADQPWIIPDRKAGVARGREVLTVTLDATRLAPGRRATGTLSITDGATKKTHRLAVTATVSEVFRLMLPPAYTFTHKDNYMALVLLSPRAVFNVPPGGTQTREFPLFNRSGAELRYRIDTSAPWVRVVPGSGRLPAGEHLLLKVTVAPPDRAGARHDTTLTVTEAGGAAPQKVTIVTHVIAPYRAPAAPPVGAGVALMHLRPASQLGRAGDAGGPQIGADAAHQIAPDAVHAIPRQETAYDIAGAGLTAFSARVRVHPKHVKDVRFGLHKIRMSFEVHVDGHIRAQSGLITAADGSRRLAADLTGAKTLKLVTRFDVPEGRNAPRHWNWIFPYGLWEEAKVYGPHQALAALPVTSPYQAEWQLIGPFLGRDTAHPPERELKLDAVYKAGDRDLRWKTLRAKKGINVDLPGLLGIKPTSKPMVAYALVYAHVANDAEVELETWYRHGMAAWVNGRQVLNSSRVNLWHVQFDRVPVKLKKGANPILLKIGQYPWGWYFRFRLRAPKAVLDGITFSPKPAG